MSLKSHSKFFVRQSGLLYFFFVSYRNKLDSKFNHLQTKHQRRTRPLHYFCSLPYIHSSPGVSSGPCFSFKPLDYLTNTFSSDIEIKIDPILFRDGQYQILTRNDLLTYLRPPFLKKYGVFSNLMITSVFPSQRQINNRVH